MLVYKHDGYAVTRHICPRNCYDACGMLAYTSEGVLQKIEGDPDHGYTKGKLCAKGYSYVNRVYSRERLKYPLFQERRGSGRWKRISWDEAMELVAQKILELQQCYGSNQSLALNKYSGNFGILHNAVEGMFNSLGATTQATGSPCWAAGLDANCYDFGSYLTSDPAELGKAKLIVLWGVNPAWTAVHSLPFIFEAKAKGAKVIVIDPVYTTTAKKADYYVQILPGSDGALALALAKIICLKDLQDKEFLARHTFGWQAFWNYLRDYDLAKAAAICGQSMDLMEWLAEMIGSIKPAFIWTGFGLQRHVNGGQNIRAINALGAVTGNIGLPGGGVHFAQQATWRYSYNILKHSTPGKKERHTTRKININNFPAELKALSNPPVKLLWVACRNPLVQDAGKQEWLEMLKEIELIVTVDHFLTPTAQCSDLVLPATSHFEELDVVSSYWHHWVGINEQAIKPYFESKSDLEIAQMLSKKLNSLLPGSCGFPSIGTAEDFLDQEFNEDFYKLLGISHWSELVNGPRRAKLPFTAWEDGIFKTPSGKYEFYSTAAKDNGLPPLPTYLQGANPEREHPYWFLTPHGQFSINSQFQNLDWLRQINPEPVIYLNPVLAQAKGLKSGDMAKVFNSSGQIAAKVQLSGDLAPDTVLCYQSWFPNDDFSVNSLIAPQAADMGKASTGFPGAALYDVFVDIEKV